MGTLINRSDITYPSWYFSDAYHDNSSRRWIYAWPSPQYPGSAAIHETNMSNDLRIRIRKWITANLTEEVIHDQVDYSYRKYYGVDKDWEHSYEVNNFWRVFYFETEESALAFTIAFSDVVSPMTRHSPRNPEDEEMCKLKPADRYAKFYYT